MIFLLSINLVNALTINEINYNPEGDDNNHEYIELSLEEPLNLTNYTIQDLSSQDSLTLLQYIPESNYALIVEEGFDYTNLNCSIYSVGATIGNNLNNDEDFILIKNLESTILDAIHYFSSWGGNNNGYSICKIPDKNGLWQECGKTPCLANSQISAIDYNIIINEFLPDPEGNDSSIMPEGEFIELYNKEDYDIDLEGFYFKDQANHKLIISDTTTLDSQKIKEDSYLVIYANGLYGFLNNEGLEKIQFFDSNDNLIDEVSYSGSEEGVSWSLIEEVWQESKPSPNEDNPLPETVNPAKIKIEQIYLGSDDKAKFGDLITLKLLINKGNSTKESVQLYIQDKNNEKISKTTKTNIIKKYTDYLITLPIQIIPNCNSKIPDGKYEIIAEGLDLEESEKIEISGNNPDLCEEVKQKCPSLECEKTESATLNVQSENLLNPISSETTGKLIFESKEIKTKRMAIYFFSLLLVLVIIQKSFETWKK